MYKHLHTTLLHAENNTSRSVWEDCILFQLNVIITKVKNSKLKHLVVSEDLSEDNFIFLKRKTDLEFALELDK